MCAAKESRHAAASVAGGKSLSTKPPQSPYSLSMSGLSCSSVSRWLLAVLGQITVEPVEFLYCVMTTTSNVVRDNLFLEKACRLDLNYSEEFCYNLTHGGDYDEEMQKNVQDRVAELESWDILLYNLPSVFFCLFVGNWSDHNGRKLVLVLPFVGQILAYVAYMLNYHFFYEMNTNYLLLGSVAGLFGGYQCLNLALYGYVSDVSSLEDRTMRLSILNGVFSLGYVVGTQIGSQLYVAVKDFYSIFSLSCLMGVIAILYTIFIVEESVRRDQSDPDDDYRPYDLSNVVASLRTAFKWRPNGDRTRLLLLIANFTIFMLPLNSNRFDYLLFQLRFKWTIEEYSNYLTTQRVCRSLGLFLLLPLISRVLKLNDALVASVLTLITTGAYFLIAVGMEAWMMFLSAVLQFNSVITVIIRSLCTKTVGTDEIGKVFAVVALGQALGPMISGPLLGFLYQATLDVFAGAYMMVIVGLLGVAFLNSVYIWWTQRSTPQPDEGEEEEEEESPPVLERDEEEDRNVAVAVAV